MPATRYGRSASVTHRSDVQNSAAQLFDEIASSRNPREVAEPAAYENDTALGTNRRVEWTEESGQSQQRCLVTIPIIKTKRSYEDSARNDTKATKHARRSQPASVARPRRTRASAALEKLAEHQQSKEESLSKITPPETQDVVNDGLDPSPTENEQHCSPVNEQNSLRTKSAHDEQHSQSIDHALYQTINAAKIDQEELYHNEEDDKDADNKVSQHATEICPMEDETPLEGYDEDVDDEDTFIPEYVKREMQEFEEGFNGLQNKFQLLDKIGEGTFSSVYKAVDLEYDHYDNSNWDYDIDEENQDQNASNEVSMLPKQTVPEAGKVVAIKRINVTSSPSRIESEIAVLRELSGHKNVVPLITAFRFKDQVIVVLPYFEHSDFREYVRSLPMTDIRCYLRALLSGLAHVHAHKVIHRDIKPTNFLYSVERKTGILVDFGLAHRQQELEYRPVPYTGPRSSTKRNAPSSSTAPTPTSAHAPSKPSGPTSDKENSVPSAPRLAATASSSQVTVSTALAQSQVPGESSTRRGPKANESQVRSQGLAQSMARAKVGTTTGTGAITYGQPTASPSQAPGTVNYARPRTIPGGALGGTANLHPPAYMGQREPGFNRKDLRPVIRVNRSGTRGFRAPEILFKHIHQTVALDVWAVGVIMLSFLTGRFPFFNANDDVEALLELAVIYGTDEMKTTAAAFNRNFVSNVPSLKPHPISLPRICRHLHPTRFGYPESHNSSKMKPPPRQAESMTVVSKPQTSPSTKSTSGSTAVEKSNLRDPKALAHGASESTEISSSHNPGRLTAVLEKSRKSRSAESYSAGVTGWDSQEDLLMACELTDLLLKLDPKKRITAEDALKHPFLAQSL